MPNVFVGRQPIFDKNLKVLGYELLYRSTDIAGSSSGVVDGDQATTTTIINTFLEIGLDKLVRDKYAAINLTEQFFTNRDKLPFSPKQVILEVLEDIRVTPELLCGIRELVDAGYIIALDDYIYDPSHAPLLELAQIVKIDLRALTTEQLKEHVQVLKQYNVKLLAEKLETPEEFVLCRDQGFDYFQGYFLSKPQIITGQALSTNKVAVLNLLSVLHDPDSNVDELTEAINMDVTTSYKLLKLINSAAFNLSRNIDSVQQGVMLLGRRKLSSWVSMLSMSSLSDRPAEILRTAMTRGKMAELLAEKLQVKNSESYFTIGLFSALDLLMQKPLTELLSPLPITAEMRTAILGHEGLMGETLACVLAYEVSDWKKVTLRNMTTDDIFIANVEAVTWANAMFDSLVSNDKAA